MQEKYEFKEKKSNKCQIAFYGVKNILRMKEDKTRKKVFKNKNGATFFYIIWLSFGKGKSN